MYSQSFTNKSIYKAKKINILKVYYRDKLLWSFTILNHLEMIFFFFNVKFKNHKIIHRQLDIVLPSRYVTISLIQICKKKFKNEKKKKKNQYDKVLSYNHNWIEG